MSQLKKAEGFDGVVERFTLSRNVEGPLSGLKFAVKDLFDVEGHVTGAGNPDWLKTHGVADKTAYAVDKLLDAGAILIGKTCTDELAYSLDGINVHYGTPVNPLDAHRVPGGSSSGSASAVASGIVDFALGTDTGGSVRVPASYCGIYGMRPSHGRISVQGVVPLAPGFDTVGWFSRDPDTLLKLGRVLLDEEHASESAVRMCIVEDAFELLNESMVCAVRRRAESLSEEFGIVEEIELTPDRLESWAQHYRVLQGWQAWHAHGDWIETVRPKMAPSIRARFEFAQTLTREQMRRSYEFQRKTADFLDHLLRGAAVVSDASEWMFPDKTGMTVLCLPATCNVPPLKTASAEELQFNRGNNLRLTCIAGLAGLPQLTIPVSVDDDLSVGLSLIARRGADMMLLELVAGLHADRSA